MNLIHKSAKCNHKTTNYNVLIRLRYYGIRVCTICDTQCAGIEYFKMLLCLFCEIVVVGYTLCKIIELCVRDFHNNF